MYYRQQLRNPMLLLLRVNLLALSLCIPLLAEANSQPIFNHDFNVKTTIAAVPVSKQQAAGIAQQYVPGRVLKVSLKGSTYRVKIVSQSGDVVSVFVDAQTGQRLKN